MHACGTFQGTWGPKHGENGTYNIYDYMVVLSCVCMHKDIENWGEILPGPPIGPP